MKRFVFTVLTLVSASLALAACEHTGHGDGHRWGHGGMGGAGGPGGQGRGPSDAAKLKRFDADGDGRVTRDELQRGLHADFAKYDVDRDGVLNQSETRVVNDERRAQDDTISPAFDWNGDGHVDFNEFANQWLTLFDQFDADHDGILTDEEINRPAAGSGGPHGGHSGGGHHHGNRGGDGS